MTKKEFELEASMRAMVALLPTNGSTEWICATAKQTAQELANLMFNEDKPYLERYPEETAMSDILDPCSPKFCNYSAVMVIHGTRITNALQVLGITTWGELWEHYNRFKFLKIQRQSGFGKRCLSELRAVMEII